MPFPCRLVETPELNEHGNVDLSLRQVGDMWFLDVAQGELKERHLSSQYFLENHARKPIVVMLPGQHVFCVDAQCYSAEKGHYGGWIVTGEPPNITVHPSIDMKGAYHGWLRNGVLSDPL